MSKAKQILVKEEVSELEKLLANRSVTISNRLPLQTNKDSQN